MASDRDDGVGDSDKEDNDNSQPALATGTDLLKKDYAYYIAACMDNDWDGNMDDCNVAARQSDEVTNDYSDYVAACVDNDWDGNSGEAGVTVRASQTLSNISTSPRQAEQEAASENGHLLPINFFMEATEPKNPPLEGITRRVLHDLNAIVPVEDHSTNATNSAINLEKTYVEPPFNIIPVTIRQVLECSENMVNVHGTAARVIVVCGLVVAVDVKDNKLVVDIDDMTAVARCVQNVNANLDNAYRDGFIPIPKRYVKVIGVLRKMKGHNYILVYRFFDVPDMNENTAHILEVTRVSMRLKKFKEDKENNPTLTSSVDLFYQSKCTHAELEKYFGWMHIPKKQNSS